MTTAVNHAAVTSRPLVSEARALTCYIEAGASVLGRRARRASVAGYRRRFTDLAGWGGTSLEDRLGAAINTRTVAAFLVTATGYPVEVDYVRRSGSEWGMHAAAAHPRVARDFHAAATGIGFSDREARQQWRVLAKITATASVAPGLLDGVVFGLAADVLTASYTTPTGKIPISWSTPLHGLTATLTSLGTLAEARTSRRSPSSRVGHWDTLGAQAPVLVATLRRYLTQIALSMRPGTVALIDTTLRHLADYLTRHHPELAGAADIRRTHIEGFKTFLNSKPGYRGNRGPAKTTTGMRLGHLRCLFDRIIEWDYTDAPPRNPIFSGDMPIRDYPLPRFLDDTKAAALLRAARNLPSLFDRVAVEVLARTGLRKGEFIALTRDAITPIGDGRWLRTPIGKMHTDRYIPLHPRVEALLQQWLSVNPPLPGSNLMFTDRGRPIPARRVDTAVYAAADAAGIGHVTPHQLRHTLATQAINNGMSLEAVAALLGHTSLSMTMTYARIADRTVAAEYFAVTAQVESLYAPAGMDSVAPVEGPNMRRLRAETTRLLGNGRCTRPAVLDCKYETVCETCAHFTTSEDHRQTLTNQLDDATSRDEPQRKQVYLQLLTRLDNTKP
jgi:integrase